MSGRTVAAMKPEASETQSSAAVPAPGFTTHTRPWAWTCPRKGRMSPATARGDSLPAWIQPWPNAKPAEQQRQSRTLRRIAAAHKIGISGVEEGQHGRRPVGDAIRWSRGPARQRRGRRRISEPSAAKPVAAPRPSCDGGLTSGGVGGAAAGCENARGTLAARVAPIQKPRPAGRGSMLTRQRAYPRGLLPRYCRWTRHRYRSFPPAQSAVRQQSPALGTSREASPCPPPAARPRSPSRPS